jgi:F-type H+-transporting ATPase subunit alpha
MPMEEQVVSIFAGVRGYLDRVPVDNIGRFEREYLNELRDKKSELLQAIRETGELSEDTEKQLAEFLADFAKKFA